MKRLLTLVICCMFSAAAPAADSGVAPLVFRPVGDWASGRDTDTCRLVRTFANGKQQITLTLERTEPDSGFSVGLSGSGLSVSGQARRASLHFVPADTVQTLPLVHLKFADGRPFYRIVGASLLPRQRQDPKSPREQRVAEIVYDRGSELTAAGGVDALLLLDGFRTDVRLELEKMDKPIALLHRCVDQLIASWGFDSDAFWSQRRHAAPAEPEAIGHALLKNVVIGTRIYHFTDAIRLRVNVNKQGAATACRIVGSDRNSSVAEPTCKVLLDDVRYLPALDAAGEPVDSFFAASMVFLQLE